LTALPRIPYATLALVGVNLTTAFLFVLNPGMLVEFGFRAEEPTFRGAVTSLFLHQNLFHLLSNMVFLAAVGGTVELMSGTGRFLLVYFVGGLVGAMAHAVMTTAINNPTVLVGASGAVAGCAGYYSLRYMQVRIPVAPKLGTTVLSVTLIWLALQVLGVFVQIGEKAPVSFWSHIGGFAIGIVLGLVFRAPDPGEILAREAEMEHLRVRSPGGKQQVAEQRLAKNPNDPQALHDLADIHHTMGEHKEEGDALLRLVNVAADSEQPAVLSRLCELGRAHELPALRRTLLAERFKGSHPAVSVMLLESVLNEKGADSHRPDTLLALAGLKMEKHPSQAKVLLHELEQGYPLHPAVELARARGWLQ
jgi:membrane associated rhomboid family serine protease